MSDVHRKHPFRPTNCGAEGPTAEDGQEVTCQTCLEFDALVERAVETQTKLRVRLTSEDPSVREMAEREILEAGVRFITEGPP